MQYLEIAQKFIRRLTEYTQYNINLDSESVFFGKMFKFTHVYPSREPGYTE